MKKLMLIITVLLLSICLFGCNNKTEVTPEKILNAKTEYTDINHLWVVIGDDYLRTNIIGDPNEEIKNCFLDSNKFKKEKFDEGTLLFIYYKYVDELENYYSLFVYSNGIKIYSGIKIFRIYKHDFSNPESYYTYEYSRGEATKELINDKITEMNRYISSKYEEYEDNHESMINDFLENISIDKSLGMVESFEATGFFRIDNEFINILKSITYNYYCVNYHRLLCCDTEVRIDLEVNTDVDADGFISYIVTNPTRLILGFERNEIILETYFEGLYKNQYRVLLFYNISQEDASRIYKKAVALVK